MIRQNCPIRWLVVITAICLYPGCRFTAHRDCCKIDTRVADMQPIVDSQSCFGSVNSDFQGITDLKNTPPFSVKEFLNGSSVALELEQCCCIAAINAPLADAIDRERKASCCTNGYNGCLDRFLAGQALQQRNKAAGAAGELFLRLVEIHLQQELIHKSFARLNELREASRFAADQGLATDNAEEELDANRISLGRKLLHAKKSQLEITTKLSALLQIEPGCLKIVEPVFDLFPVYEEVDVQDEIQLAFTTRPDLKSFSKSCCGVDPECFLVLTQLDPRLGVGLASQIKKCLLLQQLKLKNAPAQGIRKQQMQELKSARQELIRVAVTDAAIAMETGYRELVLENADLQRLQQREAALSAASELDPQGTFVQSIQNWVLQQSVRSRRISSAIEYEIAKIELLEATGQWIDICGLRPSDSSCDCCSR